MTGSGFDYSERRYIPISPKIANALAIKEGDFFVSRGNGSLHLLGRPALAHEPPEQIVFPDTMIRLRFATPSPLPLYVNYLWSSRLVREQIERKARTTAGIYKISQKDIESFRVPIAPIQEQHRIVAKIEELFSDLDAGVASLKRVRANLKRYRAAVLKAAVEGKLTEDWRAQHPAAEPASVLLERILTYRRHKWEDDQLAKFAEVGRQPPNEWQKSYSEPALPDMTDLPTIPDGWTVASIEQLTSTITSGSRDWSQFYGRGSGTFLMAQNVRMGKLDLTFQQAVDPPKNNRDRARSQVEEQDILITIVGANTGDVCRVQNSLPEHYVCQSVALSRPLLPEMAAFLEKYMISHENGQRQFRRYVYGAGRPHLSFDQIKMTAVLLPPLAEQKEIVSEAERRLSIVDEIEAQVEANLKRAFRLRQGILMRAFEGRLVPQDPTDEPADQLLARIWAQPASPSTSLIPKKNRRGRSRKLMRGNPLLLPEVGLADTDGDAG